MNPLRVRYKAGTARGPRLGPGIELVQSRAALVGQWVVVVYGPVLSRSDQDQDEDMEVK